MATQRFKQQSRVDINARRIANEQAELPDDHPVWSLLSVGRWHALRSLLDSPLSFDPERHTNAFMQSNDPERARNTRAHGVDRRVQYYLRAATYSYPQMTRCIERYSEAFPADIDWAFKFQEQVEARNHREAANLLASGHTEEARARSRETRYTLYTMVWLRSMNRSTWCIITHHTL